MHLQVGIRDPHLGFQGILGISGVVFQTATLLQVGLQLLPAPPEEKELKRTRSFTLLLPQVVSRTSAAHNENPKSTKVDFTHSCSLFLHNRSA